MTNETVKVEVEFWLNRAVAAEHRGETAKAIAFRNMAFILERETDRTLVAQVLREYLGENGKAN